MCNFLTCEGLGRFAHVQHTSTFVCHVNNHIGLAVALSASEQRSLCFGALHPSSFKLPYHQLREVVQDGCIARSELSGLCVQQTPAQQPSLYLGQVAS